MPTEEEIKKLAYTIWEQEGRPQGKDTEHYFRARQILESHGQSVIELPAPPPAMELPAPRTESQTTPKKKRASSGTPRSRAKKPSGS